VFTVVFEVHPAAGKKDEYLGLAKHLKPYLEAIDGFIDNERFESKRREGWVLSLSTWRDEKAVVRWRSQGEHHKIQEQGRNGIFSDYHLRVCEVTADSHPPEGLEVIEQRFDVTQTGVAKALAITEISPKSDATFPAHPELLSSHLGFDERAEGLTEYDVFESITNPGKMLLLTSWKSAEDSARWTPNEFAGVVELRHRRVRNVRDYGLFERQEAAQYFPEVERAGQEKWPSHREPGTNKHPTK
jgi:heme-degrading monooxygenase HmoA